MRPILLLPALLFVMLRALASASAPDPFWVPGMYDDADGDAEILQVLAVTGSPLDDPPDARPLTMRISDSVTPEVPLPESTPGPDAAARAPPIIPFRPLSAS